MYEVNVVDVHGDRRRYLIDSEDDCFIEEETDQLIIISGDETVYYAPGGWTCRRVRKLKDSDYAKVYDYVEEKIT